MTQAARALPSDLQFIIQDFALDIESANTHKINARLTMAELQETLVHKCDRDLEEKVLELNTLLNRYMRSSQGLESFTYHTIDMRRAMDTMLHQAHGTQSTLPKPVFSSTSSTVNFRLTWSPTVRGPAAISIYRNAAGYLEFMTPDYFTPPATAGRRARSHFATHTTITALALDLQVQAERDAQA